MLSTVIADPSGVSSAAARSSARFFEARRRLPEMPMIRAIPSSYRVRGLGRRACSSMPRPMAKVCHSCGKKPAFGNSRSHSMVATRRRFNPNLQKVRIDDGGSSRRVYVCTRCLKANKVVKAV